jgi:hypothetical protein
MRASQISSSGSAPQALTTASARGPWLALLEFPSAEAVKAFATDPKYAPYAAARQAGSESRFQLIGDTDLAGTIPYLPKGRGTGGSRASVPADLFVASPGCGLLRAAGIFYEVARSCSASTTASAVLLHLDRHLADWGGGAEASLLLASDCPTPFPRREGGNHVCPRTATARPLIDVGRVP